MQLLVCPAHPARAVYLLWFWPSLAVETSLDGLTYSSDCVRSTLIFANSWRVVYHHAKLLRFFEDIVTIKHWLSWTAHCVIVWLGFNLSGINSVKFCYKITWRLCHHCITALVYYYIIRPHMHRCGILLLHVSHAAWSVYLSVCVSEQGMGRWVMRHGSNGSRKWDGSHGSWVSRWWPMTHQFFNSGWAYILWPW